MLWRARRSGPPRCTACREDGIFGRDARHPRAIARVGLCREPYAMDLCASHLAQARRMLSAGGVWIIIEYPPASRDRS